MAVGFGWLVTLSDPSIAQQTVTDATVAGHVADSSGGVVAGARIEARHLETNLTSMTETDAQGRFRLTYLRVGVYELAVSHSGFAVVTRRLTLTAGSAFDVPIVLNPEGITTAVTVSAYTPMIEAARSQVAATVSEAEIRSLPLNGRNFLDVALLAPTVAPPNIASTQLFAETSAVPGVGLSVGSIARGRRSAAQRRTHHLSAQPSPVLPLEMPGRSNATPWVPLQSAGAAGDRGWPALALDAAGVVQAVWLDHRALAARRAAGEGVVRSGDHAAHDGTAMAQGSALYHAASGGESAAVEHALTPGACYCCKTALAVAPDGAIYAAWRHVYAGNRDIAMAVSRDGGRSFSAPARISEDGWSINGCPDDGPALAADEAGTVHIVWPTVVPGDEPQGALSYVSTRDGVHVTPRLRVPTAGGRKPSHPQVAIDAEGRVMVAWDESLDGHQGPEVWARTDRACPWGFGEADGDKPLMMSWSAASRGVSGSQSRSR